MHIRTLLPVSALVALAGCENSVAPRDVRPALQQVVSGKRPPRSGTVATALRDPLENGAHVGENAKVAAQAQAASVGQNLVVNQDHAYFPQNEPAIAVDAANPQRLAASANDYRHFSVKCGTYASTDGGASWHDLGNGVLSVSPLPYAGDPSVAFSPSGDAIFACLAFNPRTNASSILIARSSDLQNVSVIGAAVVTPGGTAFSDDKPYLTIDTRAGSQYYGRIYVTWTRLNLPGGNFLEAPIVISHSDDGGHTWSSLVTVTPPDLNINEGSVPGIGPNGEIYVAFENFNTPLLNINQVMVAKSTDGGATFGRPVKVADDYDICPQIVAGSCSLNNSSFRVNSFPSMGVDGNSGKIYVTWGDYRSGNADVLASVSSDGGTSWSGIVRVNDDQTTNDQFFPWLAVAGDGTVQVAYYDRRDDPDNFLLETYLSTSPGSGLAFEPAVRVTSGPSNPDVQFGGTFIGDYIGVAAANGLAHPIWTDTRRVVARSLNQDVLSATVTLGSILAAADRPEWPSPP